MTHKLPKKWSKKFTDRVEILQQNLDYQYAHESETKSNEDDYLIFENSKFVKLFLNATLVEKQLKEKQASLLGSLEVSKPKGPTEWKVQWDNNQLVCCYCEFPAIHDCAHCMFCNNVIHNTCLAEQNNELDDENELTAFNGVLATNQNVYKHTFCCRYCKDNMDNEPVKYSKTFMKLSESIKRNDCATIITNAARRYLIKLHTDKLEKAIVKLQTLFRQHASRQIYLHWRRFEARVVMFEFNSIRLKTPANHSTNILVNNYIKNNASFVITIINPIKLLQLFRTDALLSDSLSNQSFLLPGVICGQTMVVFTIYVLVSKEFASNLDTDYTYTGPTSLNTMEQANSQLLKYVPLLQTIVSLKDMNNYAYRQDIPLNFSDKIMVSIINNCNYY